MLINQIAQMKPLDGSNYHEWRVDFDMITTMGEIDYSLWFNRPTYPIVDTPNYDTSGYNTISKRLSGRGQTINV
jgi:hypothetical protein